MAAHQEDISSWASKIEAQIQQIDPCCVDRVMVMESTASTMDAAAMYAGQKHRLLVVASTQTNGRGQRGRDWHDANHHTLPCTFVLEGGGVEPRVESTMLAAICACAVHETIRSVQSMQTSMADTDQASSRLMIKWPNDIVVREGDHDRKIAGILIERKNNMTLVGIGINCTQTQEDFDETIRNDSASLRTMGITISRIDLMCRLIDRLSRWLTEHDAQAVTSYYQAHDAMINTHRSFTHDRRQFVGMVEHLDPLGTIVVRTDKGIHRLPVNQTHTLKALD